MSQSRGGGIYSDSDGMSRSQEGSIYSHSDGISRSRGGGIYSQAPLTARDTARLSRDRAATSRQYPGLGPLDQLRNMQHKYD